MSLLNWAKRQFREWSLRQSLLVLLVPCLERGDSDAVAALIPLLKARLRYFPPIIIVDSALHHLQDALKSFGSRLTPRRVVLFAHPTDAHDGFAVNAATDVDITVLRAEWWMGASSANIELFIAHVCNGATVLRQPSWSHAIANWISFDGDIDAYLGSDRGRESWTRVAEGVVNGAVDGTDSSSVRMRIYRSYFDEMITVHERGDFAAGDTINLCNFERALQLLVTSEDDT